MNTSFLLNFFTRKYIYIYTVTGANKNLKAAKRRKKTIDVDTSEVAHVLSRRDVTSTPSLRERNEFHEARSSSRAVQTNEEVADAIFRAICHREDLGRGSSSFHHLSSSVCKNVFSFISSLPAITDQGGGSINISIGILSRAKFHFSEEEKMI